MNELALKFIKSNKELSQVYSEGRKKNSEGGKSLPDISRY